MTKKNFNVFVLVVIAIIFVILLFSTSNSNKHSSSTTEAESELRLSSEQLNYLNELESEGLISIKPHLNKTLIDPTLWNRLDANVKEDFAASLAIYCGNTKGTKLYWVEIFDKYSGKKLARYSNSLGLSIY